MLGRRWGCFRLLPEKYLAGGNCFGRDIAHSFVRVKSFHHFQSFDPPLKRVLSTLVPSSSCSATLRSGNEAGMIRLGDISGTQEYFSKSLIFSWSRKKSSSRKQCPVTSPGGDSRMASMASEKIVGLRRSLLSALWDSVAADSIAYTKRSARAR